MLRVARLACSLLCVGLLSGCGLVSSSEPIGFRSYVMKDVGYEEGVALVRDTLRTYAVTKFGGLGITWDPGPANLSLDTVYSGKRRMKFFIHFEPKGPDLDLQMFALVEQLEATSGGQVGWLNPMQDVPLQEDFYQACVNALIARRTPAH